MIGYCPLEDLEPPKRQQVAPAPVVQPKTEASLEETECNYVVMAFIVGVLFLAVSDSIRA
ncbi:hypothetical protein OLOG_00041 [Ostreococcus lucimarinus virus OlV4]|jgi:hypothetical protein|nr:hypothetical protein OLOG_00041 [Ostreococcus lucimarinus virus OlV4]|tara:strand:- start:1949 stop:2128 length:180 start_codon:yes stop_codon:yes gene_type:complete